MIRAFDRYAIANQGQGWIEKTPRHIRKIGELKTTFPDAQFVLIVRDGRDVAVSLKRRRGSIENGIRMWVSENSAGQEYWNDPSVHVIKYEQLVTDFEGSVQQLADFLNVPFDRSMLEFHKSKRHFYWPTLDRDQKPDTKIHEQRRNWQVNQPIFDGRGQWRREMTEQEKAFFKKEAGEMLIQYGYAADLKW